MRLQHNVARWLLPLCVALVGCSGDSRSLSSAHSEPQTHESLPDTTNIVFVLPVEGVDGALKLILADALAAALRDTAKPAVISDTSNTQGPTVVGEISKINKRGTVSWVTANWKLRAPYGEAVATVSHDIVIDNVLWKEAGIEAVNLIVAEAEPHVIGLVSDHVDKLKSLAESAAPTTRRMLALPEHLESANLVLPPGTKPLEVQAEPTSSAVDEKPEVVVPPSMESVLPAIHKADLGSDKMTSDDVKLPALAPQTPMPVLSPESRPEPRPEPSPAPALLKAREMAKMESNASVASTADTLMPEDIAARPEPRAPVRLLPDQLQEPAKAKDDGVPDTTDLKPVSWGRPSFLMRVVSGAPGDGNEVLTSSIKKMMRNEDMTITEDPRQAAYEIKGRVIVSPVVNGRQQARIVWRVNTIGGDEVGQAVQENSIIAGSLDGEWGRVADIVTTAAVEGIQEMFDGTGKHRKKVAVKFQGEPRLQQVPGRAPPPN